MEVVFFFFKKKFKVSSDISFRYVRFYYVMGYGKVFVYWYSMRYIIFRIKYYICGFFCGIFIIKSKYG